jgi:hypothetical protein
MTDSSIPQENDTASTFPTNCTILKTYLGFELRGLITKVYPDDNIVHVIPMDKLHWRTVNIPVYANHIVPDVGITLDVTYRVPLADIEMQWAVRDE